MGKIHIQLGKTGDLLTMLPLWRMAAERTRVLVCSEFAPVLDGVSYVEPIIYEGPLHDLAGAVDKAASLGEWMSTQINGPIEQVYEYTYKPAGLPHAVTTSFQKEMWRLMGKLDQWDNVPPLVFDQRDKAREEEVMRTVLPAKRGKHRRPFMLVSLGGVTSPFKGHETLLTLIQYRFGKKFDIIDLSQLKAHRFYDLLPLYEKATCLVSTDSAPLHLARAVPELPVFALVNDAPLLWNGSSWMPNHIWYCRYSDFVERGKELTEVMDWPRAAMRPPGNAQRFVHVWNNYDRSLAPTFLPNWWPLPVWKGQCGRDSALILKDEKRVPYLRDCLRMGLQRARETDYVVLTRPDIVFDPTISAHFAKQEACYCYRQEKGIHYPIVDCFAATKKAWREMLPGIPDLLLGGDYFWSHALWAIFTGRKARSLTTGLCYRTPHNGTAKN